MISQNSAIAASEAILTRTLHLAFDRKGQSLETKRIVDSLDRIELEDACTYMTHCLRKENEILTTYQERLKAWKINTTALVLPIPVLPSVMPRLQP